MSPRAQMVIATSKHELTVMWVSPALVDAQEDAGDSTLLLAETGGMGRLETLLPGLYVVTCELTETVEIDYPAEILEIASPTEAEWAAIAAHTNPFEAGQ